MLVVQIPESLEMQLRQHASAEYPRECCGILLGHVDAERIHVRQALAALNVAEASQQKDRYTIEPLAIVRADRLARDQHMEIVGYYHSHPDHPALPSEIDRSLAWEQYVYIIVPVIREGAGRLRGWRITATGVFSEVPTAE